MLRGDALRAEKIREGGINGDRNAGGKDAERNPIEGGYNIAPSHTKVPYRERDGEAARFEQSKSAINLTPSYVIHTASLFVCVESLSP